MTHHCTAVVNVVNAAADSAAGRAPLVVGDLPFGSYLTPKDAALSAVRLVKEAGVGASQQRVTFCVSQEVRVNMCTRCLSVCPWIGAIKLEGGQRVVPQVEAIANAGIAVVGHIGLTPQVLHKIFLVHALSH